ncbi:hypothetical protein THRCLA_05668 [Thraustotheca clavata]|uniref:Transmembrane protein n=1 Tax=Thraustotheca clavata TaxID=74557 RepID=A0A1V9ZV64_9STRA|nr:hypothetical protein THRCLA_05668 [Thraustotheca clavata]
MAAYLANANGTRVKGKRQLLATFNKLYEATITFIGVVIIILVLIDSVVNNWAINDYIGKAHFLKTLIATSTSAGDLESKYAFPSGRSISDMSEIGIWMLYHSIMLPLMMIVLRLYALRWYIFAHIFNRYVRFKASYAADLTQSPTVKLGVASNSLAFVRGDALTYAFLNDDVVNLANSSMKSYQLNDLGYSATRRYSPNSKDSSDQYDNTTKPTMYPKNFCTGGSIATEMAFGCCNMTLVYSDTLKKLL